LYFEAKPRITLGKDWIWLQNRLKSITNIGELFNHFNMLKTVQNIDVTISGLKLLSKIGEGGMSVVYLAEQVSLKRKVAVKVMRLDVANNELDVQRFKHEAKTIARLDHPNIINIYNIGLTANGEIFYTMPFLNHGDFSSYIIEDEQEFILLLQSICDGLAFAHDRGVIHRDIKPENLLFDKFGNVRIADFGIAISQESSRVTKEHQIVGSAQYMSPEQARSLTVDVHSDIYSLGIVIYERLTGRVPFDSEESISVLVNHVSMQPDKLPPKMRHWQKLIDKCLAKSPDDRYQSMVELKIALSKIPTSSLQRTNSSIQNILSDEQGKHLKWFLPSLIILLVIALIGLNSSKNDVVDSVATVSSEKLIIPVIENKNVENPALKNEVIVKDENIFSSEKEDIFEEQQSVLIDDESTQQSNDEITGIDNPDFNDENVLTEEQEIDNLMVLAQQNIEDYQLSKPRNNNATDQLLKVLSMSPDNPEAIKGMESIGQKYFLLVEKALNSYEFNSALKHSLSINRFNIKTNFINENFDRQKKALLQTIDELDLFKVSMSSDQTMTLVRIIKVFSPEDVLLEKLAYEASLRAGPQIGDKLMDELGVESILLSNQLAVTLTEITVDDYSQFSDATNRVASKCKHEGGGLSNLFASKNWSKPFFPQNEDHPVVCVSHADAVAYSQWLSQQTNNKYRLPTRSEWLLLASENNNIFKPCKTANVSGQEAKKIRNKEDKYICTDSYIFTAPVATFAVNKIGVFDVQGNVSEWIACNTQPCLSPIAMGSSWFNGKQSNKLLASEKLLPDLGRSYVGFRLVRDL
jgi:serine/threonine protein kinase/formylglycine-generating enzyme required for sulfatase activity